MITRPNVKINLGLRVLRKRADGYHDLETLFLPYFGLHDTLEIVRGDDFSETSARLFAKYGPVPETVPEGFAPNLAQGITEDGKLMITIARAEGVDWNPLEDLCARAYKLLDGDFGLPPVKIFLEKNSPVGAGLGGGSADAAFTLKMLDGMFSLGIGEERLAGYAGKLGSDCPFFIYNRPMFGEGRGEELSPFDPGIGEDFEIRVIVPEGVSVSTAEAYRGIQPREDGIPLRETLAARPLNEWRGLVVNDFETTVFASHPELAAIKESLYESGAIYASMSGSGSALFGIYRK